MHFELFVLQRLGLHLQLALLNHLSLVLGSLDLLIIELFLAQDLQLLELLLAHFSLQILLEVDKP